MTTDLIEKYRPVICGLMPPVVRDPRLLMDACGDVKIHYAPFEYLNPNARVVLVGITPGPTQMVNANNEARRTLLAGKTGPEAVQQPMIGTHVLLSTVNLRHDLPGHTFSGCTRRLGGSRLARGSGYRRRFSL